jgi:hypothetical protein
MIQGVITRYLAERHFGFILCNEGEFFFHELNATAIPQPPKRGDRCLFEIGEFKGRKQALNLRPIPGGAQ